MKQVNKVINPRNSYFSGVMMVNFVNILFNKSFLLFTLLLSLSLSTNAQIIESISQAGHTSNNDLLIDFILDDEGNYYLMLESRGGPIKILGNHVTVPPGFLNDNMIIAKVSSDLELIWYQLYDHNDSVFLPEAPGKLVLDNEGNLYASIHLMRSTKK
ncbi:MAG: hypothetical protein AAGJ93_03320, partial [Bacteroidota bacterium]